MSAKLMFDTLNYAKILENGGVAQADFNAASLAQVLSHNLYTKDEIDMRFEQALNRIDQTLNRSDQRFNKFCLEQQEWRLSVEKQWAEFRIATEKQLSANREEMHAIRGEMRGEMYAMELRFEKKMYRYFVTTISVLGSLIVAAGTISTFAHAIFR